MSIIILAEQIATDRFSFSSPFVASAQILTGVTGKDSSVFLIGLT